MSTPNLDEVIAVPTRFGVSLKGLDGMDLMTYEIGVERRNGPDTPLGSQWAVIWVGHALSRKGEWDWEPLPSSRTDKWLAKHRFSFDEAIAWARKLAPDIEVNGRTARQALARHAPAEYMIVAVESTEVEPDPTTEAMVADLVAQEGMAPVDRQCPDGGRCHHSCQDNQVCWRVTYAGPLSGVYLGDRWPDDLGKTGP